MPDPSDTNDDWAALAAELKHYTPPAPAADPGERAIGAEAVEPHPADPRTEDEAPEGEAGAAADEEFEDGDDAPTGEPAGEGEQPGTGRKRRRRRRRRRKGGGTPAEVAAALAEDADEGEGEAEPAAELEPETDEEPAMERADGDEFGAPEGAEAEREPASFGLEEDTASEVLRELIATWNVPSWDEIVSGLHRPN